MAMIVLNLTTWRNSILFPPRGHSDTFRCSPGQLRSRQHTVKSATYFTVQQSKLVEAPQLLGGLRYLWATDLSTRSGGKPHQSFGMWWLCYLFCCLLFGCARFHCRPIRPYKVISRSSLACWPLFFPPSLWSV